MKKLLCIILACIFVFSGCGKIDNKASEKLSVVVTVFPPYDFVRRIAGDKVELKMLLKPGGDVHSYEPTPQDIMEISECGLFIYTGGENDSWVENVLGSAKNVKTLKMMDCVELIEESHEGHDHESEPDDHVWTSPVNAAKIAERIGEELCALDPDNADAYRSNTESYVSELRELDAEFQQTVDNGVRRKLIFADRFPVRYFTERYGLEYLSAFPGCSGETEADPATIADIIDEVKDDGIPVVLYGEMSDQKTADTVALATGAEKRMFHSCHNLSKEDFESGKTYIDIMKDNISVLREALN